LWYDTRSTADYGVKLMVFSAHNKKAAKLTGEKVMDMRKKYATGDYTQARLSREFQVSISTIRNVLSGITWQELPLVKSDDEIMTQAALDRYEAKESEKRFRISLGLPPVDPLVKLAGAIANARHLDIELEQLKGEEK